MFDGRWRSTFESGLKPLGDNIRRTGITANMLTTTGLVMAVSASLAIANADGTTRPATWRDCTHVRWNFDKPLSPGQKGTFRFRAGLL